MHCFSGHSTAGLVRLLAFMRWTPSVRRTVFHGIFVYCTEYAEICVSELLFRVPARTAASSARAEFCRRSRMRCIARDFWLGSPLRVTTFAGNRRQARFCFLLLSSCGGLGLGFSCVAVTYRHAHVVHSLAPEGHNRVCGAEGRGPSGALLSPPPGSLRFPTSITAPDSLVICWIVSPFEPMISGTILCSTSMHLGADSQTRCRALPLFHVRENCTK